MIGRKQFTVKNRLSCLACAAKHVGEGRWRNAASSRNRNKGVKEETEQSGALPAVCVSTPFPCRFNEFIVATRLCSRT